MYGTFYLHLPININKNVGKYTSPMDPMGHKVFDMILVDLYGEM